MEIFSVMGGVRGAEIWAARAWTGGAGVDFRLGARREL